MTTEDSDNKVNNVTAHVVDEVCITDRGLAYGDGLFETIAYVNGTLNHWSLHWQRLNLGAERLSIDLPNELFFQEQIENKLNCDLGLSDRVIKIVVTRGQGGRGYLYSDKQEPNIIISMNPWPERSVDDYQKGINAFVCQTCLAQQPSLAGIKHLNRLEQVLGRNEFSGNQFGEGLMLSCFDSLLVEGTASNLFFVTNGRLMTPLIDTCGVKGTMRSAILALAEQKNIPVEEDHYTLHELQNASEIFFTNSLWGILPVVSITSNEQRLWFYERQLLDKHKEEVSISTELARVINNQLNRPEILQS